MKADYISSGNLRNFLRSVLLKEGVDDFSADSVSRGLLHASLRGVDSHGIRLFPHYIAALKSGRINPKPVFSFNETSACTGILDADDSFGHAAGMKAVDNVVKLAEKAGMGAVAVKHSTHFGAASFFGLEIAENDMIGLNFTNSDPLIPPTGSKKAYLGNNPICFTAPCEDEEPICLDMATSMITFNKVLRYREDGEMVAPGLGFDVEGKETTDPNRIISLAPAGGYKGYGLSLMVEIFCALLSGMPFGPYKGHMYNDPLDTKRNLGHFFIAIKLDAFVEPVTFKQRMKQLSMELRNQDPVDSNYSVLVAGDPEKIVERERLKTGIPVGEVEKGFLSNLSDEYRIQLQFQD